MTDTPDLSVLFSWHTRPHYMAPPAFGARQVLCGPSCEDAGVDGRVESLSTPVGRYDIAAVIERLPAAQRPDLLIVKADASRRNLPANLAAVRCPKILIVGDTHQYPAPLKSMLDYADAERYDAVVSDHKRHHLHYFIEAGHANVHWLPGLLVRDWEVPFHPQRRREVALIGQVGDRHPQRRRVVDAVVAAGQPIEVRRASQAEASRRYAASLLTLNQSLNGDLNLRVFEALAAGACLLTDRLAPQAGLELLFHDGEHLVLFDGAEDLVAKIDHYLAHFREAGPIALSGRREFRRAHAPAIKRRLLLDLVQRGRIPPLYTGGGDRRGFVLRSRDRADLRGRVARYEYFQERHRAEPGLSVLFLPGADARLLCDLADLPRLRLSHAGALPTLCAAAEVADQIAAIAPAAALSEGTRWDVLCVSTEEAAALDEAWLAGSAPPAAILATDWEEDAARLQRALAHERLTRHGYAEAPEPAGLFARPAPA